VAAFFASLQGLPFSEYSANKVKVPFSITSLLAAMTDHCLVGMFTSRRDTTNGGSSWIVLRF